MKFLQKYGGVIAVIALILVALVSYNLYTGGADIVSQGLTGAGETNYTRVGIDGDANNTPLLTMGDAEAEDTTLLFDGNAQDFYVALDDSADDLLIGLGSTVGTTPAIGIDENLAVTTYGDLTFGGTTPVLTIGDAGAEDTAIVFDGNAQDYYVALDDSGDTFVIGLGSTIGTTPILTATSSLDVTFAQRMVINGVEGADSAATNETLEIAFTSPVDTTGTNTHDALTIDLAIGNATGGTNNVRGIQIDGITGDAQVTETAINVGSGWDVGLAVDSPADFTYVQGIDSGATGDALEIAFTSPVDTTGTNTHNAFTIDLAIGNATGGTNHVNGIQIDAITDDPQVVETAIHIGDEWDYAIDTNLPIVSSAMYWFDDFLGDAVLTPYAEINGADAQAAQAIAVEQYGVYQITSGDVGDTVANDMEALHLGLEWQADQGALVFEVRLHIDTAVTTAFVACGLTDDSTTAELAASVGGSDAITTTATDALVFVYDTRADTDQWFAIGVAGGTDATGNGATGTAPVADTYQTLRIEVDDGGADARFYINGALVKTLTANAVTPTVALSPFCQVYSADNAASVVIDIDYILIGADRD